MKGIYNKDIIRLCSNPLNPVFTQKFIKIREEIKADSVIHFRVRKRKKINGKIQKTHILYEVYTFSMYTYSKLISHILYEVGSTVIQIQFVIF